MSTLIFKTKKHFNKAEKGMAIIAAIFLCLILTALGAIAITISTGDIKSSVALVGEKTAFTATEKGIFRLVENFDPADLDASERETDTADLANDTHSRYQIGKPFIPDPASGPESIPLSGGYQIGGGQTFGLARYNAVVRGVNTKHNTGLEVTVGLGYGPVDITPTY